MKKSVVFWLIILFVWQFAIASVSVQVYKPDGETPFDSQEIMVGQKLTLKVVADSVSDSNDLWSGGLFIEGQDRALGTLVANDSDPNTRDCDLAHYSAAGDYAAVFAWKDSDIWGYDMYASDANCIPGDWFTIDYYAEKPGNCQVKFYEYNVEWGDPNILFNFTHLPSRDFNQDGSVDLADFSQLAACWLIPDCNDPNDCIAVDLNFDASVDVIDLAMFADFWLWDGTLSGPTPPVPPDPNYIYSIVDTNGLDELTIEIGQSITLYVNLETVGQDNLQTFDIEVQISEPNLAAIDNTGYPLGTAKILALLRSDIFDNWGPGIEQPEGIRLVGGTLSFTTPISDGSLASFVYTANNIGDVTLNLANIASTYFGSEVTNPTLESILIHQVIPEMPDAPESMMSMSLLETTDTDMSEVVDFLEMICEEDKDFKKIMTKSEWDKFIDALSKM